MLLELYQGYSIGFYGHTYSIIKLSNGNKYALFSGKYNHFLDFELVNYGFTEKWINSIHTNGISKRDNFLCYETGKDLKEFIIKLIIKLIEHREYNIQVCVPKGHGRILSMLKSRGIGYVKRDGDYYLTTGDGNTIIYEDENYISSENYSCDDNTADVLNITTKRRHKLNIDFKE